MFVLIFCFAPLEESLFSFLLESEHILTVVCAFWLESKPQNDIRFVRCSRFSVAYDTEKDLILHEIIANTYLRSSEYFKHFFEIHEIYDATPFHLKRPQNRMKISWRLAGNEKKPSTLFVSSYFTSVQRCHVDTNELPSMPHHSPISYSMDSFLIHSFKLLPLFSLRFSLFSASQLCLYFKFLHYLYFYSHIMYVLRRYALLFQRAY